MLLVIGAKIATPISQLLQFKGTMNGATQPQESPQAVAQALEQLQALQLQQQQLQAQTATSGLTDADLLSLHLPSDFGGAPSVHHPGTGSAGSVTRSDPLESFQVQDAMRISSMEQDPNGCFSIIQNAFEHFLKKWHFMFSGEFAVEMVRRRGASHLLLFKEHRGRRLEINGAVQNL